MIEYRIAKKSDAHALAEYVRIVGGETDFLSYGSDTFNMSDEREARFIERFEKSKKDIMLVALDNGRVVANASLEASRVARFSHRSELSITVLKEYWGKGIGSRLMEILIDFAKENRVELIYLEARADNERALSLYKKFGFIKKGEIENFFKINGEYYGAVIMTLEI